MGRKISGLTVGLIADLAMSRRQIKAERNRAMDAIVELLLERAQLRQMLTEALAENAALWKTIEEAKIGRYRGPGGDGEGFDPSRWEPSPGERTRDGGRPRGDVGHREPGVGTGLDDSLAGEDVAHPAAATREAGPEQAKEAGVYVQTVRIACVGDDWSCSGSPEEAEAAFLEHRRLVHPGVTWPRELQWR